MGNTAEGFVPASLFRSLCSFGHFNFPSIACANKAAGEMKLRGFDGLSSLWLSKFHVRRILIMLNSLSVTFCMGIRRRSGSETI